MSIDNYKYRDLDTAAREAVSRALAAFKAQHDEISHELTRINDGIRALEIILSGRNDAATNVPGNDPVPLGKVPAPPQTQQPPPRARRRVSHRAPSTPSLEIITTELDAKATITAASYSARAEQMGYAVSRQTAGQALSSYTKRGILRRRAKGLYEAVSIQRTQRNDGTFEKLVNDGITPVVDDDPDHARVSRRPAAVVA